MVRQYALSHNIEMGDALIAATALKHHELLCTGNAKHFTPISGLNWSTIYRFKTAPVVFWMRSN